jgi:hypothetical protein
MRDPALDERAQPLRVPQIEHADAAPGDLVLVRGTDAPPGGADLLARGALAVEQLVIRHHQMGAVAHIEPSRHVHAVGDQLLDLVEKRIGVEHDSVTNGAPHPRVKDAAWDLMEHERATADRHGVPGIRAALVSHDPIGALRDHVDELPFALVAPLDADDDERADALIEHEGKLVGR